MKKEALALANEFDEMTDPFQSLAYAHKAQAMICRLVEELDRNKIYIQKMEDALGCDVSYYELLNKPVNPFAWVDDCFSFFTDDDYSMLDDELKEGMIPLYTHPQTKPLSDEEIREIIKDCIEDDYNMIANPYALARAIEERHGIK